MFKIGDYICLKANSRIAELVGSRLEEFNGLGPYKIRSIDDTWIQLIDFIRVEANEITLVDKTNLNDVLL